MLAGAFTMLAAIGGGSNFTIDDVYSCNHPPCSSWTYPGEAFLPQSTFVHSLDPYDTIHWDLSYVDKYNPSTVFTHSHDVLTPIPGEPGDPSSIFNQF